MVYGWSQGFPLRMLTYHVNNNKGNSIRIESSHRGEGIQPLKYATNAPTFDADNSLFKGLTALAKSWLLRNIFGYHHRLTNADGLSRFYIFFSKIRQSSKAPRTDWTKSTK